MSLMTNEKECSRVSYFSGPLTIAVVLLPFNNMTFSPVWRRQKDRIRKFVLLDIFAPSPLILILTGLFIPNEGSFF